LFQLGYFSFGANVTSQNSFPPLWYFVCGVSVGYFTLNFCLHSLAFLFRRFSLFNWLLQMGLIGPDIEVILPARIWQVFTLADSKSLVILLLVVAVCLSMVLPFWAFLSPRNDTISKVRINHTMKAFSILISKKVPVSQWHFLTISI